jgi:uncharacterized membrane protein
VTRTAKIGFFIVAVLAMVGLATASIAMAEDQFVLCIVLFVITIAIIAGAFIVKARIKSETAGSDARREGV